MPFVGDSATRAGGASPPRRSSVTTPAGFDGASAFSVSAAGLARLSALSRASFSAFSRFFLFVSSDPPSNSLRSFSLYSSNEPLNTRTYPGCGGVASMSPFLTCQISSTTAR